MWETFGDYRWTPDLVVSTWMQAETGLPPVDSGMEYKVGASGGGFDRMDFVFPESSPDPSLSAEDIDLGITLNRTEDGQYIFVHALPFSSKDRALGSRK